MNEGARKCTRLFIAFLIAISLAILLYYPLFQCFTGCVFGGMGDAQASIWSLWWTKKALFAGESPFYSDYILAPEGVSLSLHTHHFALGLGFALISLLLDNPIVGYNIIHITSFLLTFFFCFLLINVISRRSSYTQSYQNMAIIGPVAGATLFTLSPWRLSHSVWIHFNATELFPITILVALMWVKHKKIVWSILFSACFTSIFFTDLNYTLFLAFALMVLFGKELFEAAMANPKSLMRHLVMVILMFSISISPWIASLLKDVSRYGWYLTEGANAKEFTDLAFLLYPPNPALSSIWKQYIPEPSIGQYMEYNNLYIGLLPLLIITIGLISIRKFKYLTRWFVLLGCSFILALGNKLVVAGVDTGLPLPYSLVKYIPLVAAYRVPGRIIVLFTLSAAVIVGVILSELEMMLLLKIKKYGLREITTFFLMLMLLLGEMLDLMPNLLVHLERCDADVAYYMLGLRTDESVLLGIPFGFWGAYFGVGYEYARFQMWQYIHQKRLISGHIARIPYDKLIAQYVDHPFLYNLIKVQDGYLPTGEELIACRADAQAIAKEWDIRYVIIDNDRARFKNKYPLPFSKERLKSIKIYLEYSLPLQLIYHKNNIILFEVRGW